MRRYPDRRSAAKAAIDDGRVSDPADGIPRRILVRERVGRQSQRFDMTQASPVRPHAVGVLRPPMKIKRNVSPS